MSSCSRPDRHRTPSFTRATTHFGASKSDLERDSGFSDASSEHLSTVDLTDSEDAGRNYPIGPQVAVMGGPYAGLSPMIIMNNFILKQPSPMAPAEKQWGFPSPVEVMPQSQMVILQTMVSNGSSSSSNTGSENTRQSKSYVPILKSYPKIAPHPDVPTKRVGSSKVRVSSTSGYDQRPKRHHHGHRLYSSPSLQPALQTAIKSIPNFEAANQQSQAAESQDSDKCLSELLPYTNEFSTDIDNNGMDADQDDGLSTDVNKLKRFSNTYNILNKSGLLGITMRTKQLIKENKRTQGQLQQLQEQTVMLLEAQSTGDPQLWTKLQLSLQHTDKEQCGARAQRALVQ
ncbi:CLOCK-interacting pacemaker a [Cyclopterus lumpus]|uniref:CLOCK-interacting pacemaker a n=1 Tax=Cyclopterus lumpus TaxID=8103 RepID=UPI001486A3AF|nr:CLOCK-interacting pacemaker a [Cyclopterus lumpus]